MVRKPVLSIQTLLALGPEKLAQLVLDETGRNAPFRKLAKAALAASKGPDAVAKLVDRRLSALEKARSFIEWEKVRPFRDDLRATVATITGELAPASAVMAVEKLLRFIATHETVFERVDDSSGHVQGVYYDAIEAFGTIVEKLTPDEADLLPEQIMAALGKSSHGYLIDVTHASAVHLAEPSLQRWDQLLLVLQKEAEKLQKDKVHRSYDFNDSQLRDVRQAIAGARNDLDGLIALEEKKHPNSQDTIRIAERLLGAGRAKEALVWVRKKLTSSLRYMSAEDLAQLLVTCVVTSTSHSAQAATATGQFNVTITIQSNCIVQSATDLAFGNAGIITANLDAQSTISVQCTNTTPYTIGINAGNGAGATVAARKMTGPAAATVTYSVYRDAARTLAWGTTVGTDTVAGTGNGNPQPITVYGRVPPQAAPAAGGYTDTLTVTVTY